MKIKQVKKLEETYLQCDITTLYENFYVFVNNAGLLLHNSPAIVFGRDSDGQFVLTDKSGFGAKGYDGKAKSADDLENMFKSRPGYQKNPEGYGEFIGNMVDIFDEYERAVPKDFVGFFKGDLLYFNTPGVEGDYYVFTPNVVTYSVRVDSNLGQRIGKSKTGVVIHRYIDPDSGTEGPINIDVNGTFQGEEVLVFPPVTVQQGATINDEEINQMKATVAKFAPAIDKLLDKSRLTQLKISDFATILYTYTNKKVDGDLSNLGDDFEQWLMSSNLSDPKKKRIFEWIKENEQGFRAVWQVVKGIQQVKNDVINQFDSHNADVVASINGQTGGEGYVMTHPSGDIKLVNRSGFTAANRAKER